MTEDVLCHVEVLLKLNIGSNEGTNTHPHHNTQSHAEQIKFYDLSKWRMDHSI
jgi:hypothetical protein